MTQLNEKEKQLVTLISEECRTPSDVTAKLKNLFAGTLEIMLEAEFPTLSMTSPRLLSFCFKYSVAFSSY